MRPSSISIARFTQVRSSKAIVGEASRVVRDLFACWVSDPSLLPPAYAGQAVEQGAPRVVADYIAGMTDNYILQQHREWLAH